MYFVVFLKDLNRNYAVKSGWIQTIPIVNMLKNGLNGNIQHVVFISSDKTAKPNFTLPISEQLSEQPACYSAYLIKNFGNLQTKNIRNIFIFTKNPIVFR